MTNEWDEQKHPREDDGTFARKGSGNLTKKWSERPDKTGPKGGKMPSYTNPTYKDRKDWDETGHGRATRKTRTIMKDHINKLLSIERMEKVKGMPKGQHSAEWHKLQRETAENLRMAKHDERVEIERRPAERTIKRVQEKYDQLEQQIDEIEERYGTGVDGLEIPDEETSKKYKQLKQKRKRLGRILDMAYEELDEIH